MKKRTIEPYNALMTVFGSVLRTRRLELGYSYEDTRNVGLELKESFWKSIEVGQFKPSEKNARNIATVLQLDVKAILLIIGVVSDIGIQPEKDYLVSVLNFWIEDTPELSFLRKEDYSSDLKIFLQHGIKFEKVDSIFLEILSKHPNAKEFLKEFINAF